MEIVAVPGAQGQIVDSEMSLIPNPVDRRAHPGLVLHRVDFPELAVCQFVPRITEKLFHERVEIQNVARRGIHQHNTVPGAFK